MNGTPSRQPCSSRVERTSLGVRSATLSPALTTSALFDLRGCAGACRDDPSPRACTEDSPSIKGNAPWRRGHGLVDQAGPSNGQEASGHLSVAVEQNQNYVH